MPREHDTFDDTIYINDLVIINTQAKDEINYDSRSFWWRYGYVRKNYRKIYERR